MLGAAFAVVLLAVFADAAVTVQTTPALQRPDWRAIGRAIGPAAVPRAIVFAGDNYAIPLKLYVPNVNWVQPSNRQVMIDQINLVGALKWLPPQRGRAPLGARLIGVGSSSGVGIDRYAFARPRSMSVNGLTALEAHLFRRYHGALVVFFQQPRA